MTQAQTKDQEATQKKTPQQHHQKAAEHHESGDPKIAAQHAYIAQGHTAQAIEQETEASKKCANTLDLKK